MSYSVTVYFNDANIASTRIRSGSFIDETGNYGDDFYSAGGFTNATSFEATPKSGYEVEYWVYRIGSTTATQRFFTPHENHEKYQYNDNVNFYANSTNKLTYTGEDDIYIRAVGRLKSGGSGGGSEGGDTNTWLVVNKGSLGTISTQQDLSLIIASYKVYRYAVQFAYSGTATIYTTGDVDTYGEYSDNTTFDSSSGSSDYIKRDNNSGDGNNFRIRTDTVTAGTTYYVWVSGVTDEDTGTTTLHIIPPSGPTTETVDKWSWSSSNGSASATQTSDAYDAVKNKKATTNFSHLVWNDMVDKVNEVIKACSSGRTWDSSYATYANTKMSSTPYYLTAVKFNSLRNNIEIVGNTYLELGYKTGIEKVEAGDYVKGSYFITLADYINDCIDNL